MVRFLTLLATSLLLLAAPARAEIPAPPSQWYQLPGLNAAAGAQWPRAFAYSTPPNIVYAGLEGGGVFKSVTGGATWSAFNDGFPNPAITNVRALLASSTGTTVYAGTDDGIYKSTGGAWEPLAQGTEPDPAKPTKLNQSVQSLVSLTGQNTMLAGVFSGGVYKSTDDGATWQPPAANNGMPLHETIYGLTNTIPGVVYATGGGGGVYVSTNAGSSWNRVSDGIPGVASPIATWGYPQRPDILFTSTGSNGIYRSDTAGLQWREINDNLGAVRARGFQIFTADNGAHLYAATENALWHAYNGPAINSPPPRWGGVTKDGLATSVATNEIMWALTAPEIPSQGAVGLIAGTQSDGGFFLAFEPPESNCPYPPNASADCPKVTGTVQVGKTLSASVGQWTGTEIIEYAYQWQRCTSASPDDCSDIPDAEESTYVVPEGALVPSPNLRYRIQITATNPAPTFGIFRRYSTVTAEAVANPDEYPGSQQASAPGISVEAPGETTDPQVGDTMYAEYGITPSVTTDGWFNPKANPPVGFQWLRCVGPFGTDCNEIPGATSRSYTLGVEDGTHTLRVRVRGTNVSGTLLLTSAASYDVESLPAAIGEDLPPDEPGGAPKSQAPTVRGDAYVGETLVGDVGGWKDPTTDFLRRWVRCDADGTACTYIQEVDTTDPEDGPSYEVRADDLGYTLRLRVTADVNNDLGPDGIDNHLPNAVEVDTPASAVVTYRPVPPPVSPTPGPGGTPPPPGAADITKPALSGVRMTRKRFRAKQGTTFQLRLSEAARLRLVISRGAKGRKVKARCRPKKKSNRRKPKCTYQKTVTTVRRDAAAGDVSIRFKRKLKPGRYRATIVATDAAGNVSSPGVLQFRVLRKKR